LLHLWVFLYIHTKIPRFTGCFGSLHGIKIHFREFLYGFMHKCNKLLAENLLTVETSLRKAFSSRWSARFRFKPRHPLGVDDGV
ncbi:MAG: hypothetical protein LBG26_02625, partial [Treponema sp.]|nr:hypothetical protein [Treponema sp.]